MPAQVCNIGPRNQRRRKWIGYAGLLTAGLLSGILIGMHAPPIYRLAVFPFYAVGFISLLESQAKVCVRYAYQKKVDKE